MRKVGIEERLKEKKKKKRIRMDAETFGVRMVGGEKRARSCGGVGEVGQGRGARGLTDPC